MVWYRTILWLYSYIHSEYLSNIVNIMAHRCMPYCISWHTGACHIVYHGIQVHAILYIMAYRCMPYCISWHTGACHIVYHGIQVHAILYIMAYKCMPYCIGHDVNNWHVILCNGSVSIHLVLCTMVVVRNTCRKVFDWMLMHHLRYLD